jgi:hypothetical protein
MKKFLNNVRDIPVAGFLALLRSTYTDSSALIQWQEILAAGVDSLKALSKIRPAVRGLPQSFDTHLLPAGPRHGQSSCPW